jgi:hypothetical protein
MIFVLNYVYILYYIFCFAYVGKSLYLWNETNLIVLYDLFFLLISFIHMCIQRLDNFSPFHHLFPYPHPLPPPPTPWLPGRNYFALVSNFVEENITVIGKTKGFC